MKRSEIDVVYGDEALFLLGMRRSMALGDGRAEAVLEILRACAESNRGFTAKMVAAKDGES